MAYTIRTNVIPGAVDGVDENGAPHPLGVVRLDAPDGMVVVSAFGNLNGGDVDYAPAFLGAANTLHSTSVPGGHQLVLDDDGRPVAVVFFGVYGPDLRVSIVCVAD